MIPFQKLFIEMEALQQFDFVCVFSFHFLPRIMNNEAVVINNAVYRFACFR
jgi:hypothetical protein